MSTIYQQLRDAQIELKAPKTETGRFGKSRSAEAILEAAKPVLAKHKLVLVVTDEVVLIGDRHYVKATAAVYDDEGATISATALAWEGQIDKGLDASQVTGKTSSYARKYAMGGLLAIDDAKDADTYTEASSPTPAQTATTLGAAKNKLNKAFEFFGHITPEAKQAVLDTVLGKTTVETVTEVNEVLQALEDGLV
jgi:hypothetical protein